MELVINERTIGKDEHGRYSLNDLHKAAGGESKHQPNSFMRTKSFKETADFLTPQIHGVKPVERKTGRYGGGTWVCEQLVIEYAMWVNVEFKVKVIQFFIDSRHVADTASSMKALNDLTVSIESDIKAASICGQYLSKYKKIKAENEIKWIESVNDAQLNLGFKK